MKYKNYLNVVSQQFEKRFSNISAEYNFDYGDEFEIALCRALREFLPQKYGICRGFVVSEDNQVAGDDIIIYDKEHFPTLRLLPQDEFAQKNYVPAEAVYAYIEAKHTLSIKGKQGQSLVKAWEQVSQVKAIPRDARPTRNYDPYFSFPDQLTLKREGWPEILNPIYGVVIARQVRISERKPVIQDTNTIYQSLVGPQIDKDPPPDMIIAGDSNILLPFLTEGSSEEAILMPSPFYVEGKTDLNVWKTDRHAFGIGICTLLWALDTIRLSPLPWSRILDEGINERKMY